LGAEPLSQLINRFFQKVPSDPILAPVFAHMSPEHFQRVAQFIAEAPKMPAGGHNAHNAHPPQRKAGHFRRPKASTRSLWSQAKPVMLRRASENEREQCPQLGASAAVTQQAVAHQAIVRSLVAARIPVRPSVITGDQVHENGSPLVSRIEAKAAPSWVDHLDAPRRGRYR